MKSVAPVKDEDMGWSGEEARGVRGPTTDINANEKHEVSDQKSDRTGPATAAAVSKELFLGIDVAAARHVVVRFVPGEGAKPAEGMTDESLVKRVGKRLKRIPTVEEELRQLPVRERETLAEARRQILRSAKGRALALGHRLPKECNPSLRFVCYCYLPILPVHTSTCGRHSRRACSTRILCQQIQHGTS